MIRKKQHIIQLIRQKVNEIDNTVQPGTWHAAPGIAPSNGS
jgi:hypothetical protein